MGSSCCPDNCPIANFYWDQLPDNIQKDLMALEVIPEVAGCYGDHGEITLRFSSKPYVLTKLRLPEKFIKFCKIIDQNFNDIFKEQALEAVKCID